MRHPLPLRHVLLLGLVAALIALVPKTFTALGARGGQLRAGLQAEIRDVGHNKHTCLPIAHDLLRHWKEKVRWGERRFAASAPPSTAEVLRQLGLATPADYCFGKLHFDGRSVSLLSSFKEHCNSSATRRASIGRSHLYLQRFNRLLGERQEASRLSPFTFYIDTTDGTRNNPRLFQQLGVPILTVSRSPSDGHTIPVPDIDMLLGVFADWDYQALPSTADQALYPAATEYLAPIYQDMGWASPWRDKLPQAVFRGTCHPTIMSNRTNPHSRQPLRAQLCAAHGANPKFDIWMTNFEPCSQPSLANKPMCTQCKACLQGDRQLSWEEQSLYRYQLIVDGHGATYNSAVWKLLSGSLAVRLRPDGWDAPIFEQFYDPLFADVVVHSNVTGLPRVVEECEERIGECQQKGQEARRRMKCLLQSWQLDDYLWGVFLYMHDAVHGQLS